MYSLTTIQSNPYDYEKDFTFVFSVVYDFVDC